MKILKRGFSLAELLIAMGIVSVIATMGFSIAKQGLERAYDTYVYAGYHGLSLAIGHAVGRNISIGEGGLGSFVNDLANTLDAKKDGSKFIAPNGISYDFIELPEVNSKHYYSVVMQVPRAQKNGVGKHTICLNYAPDEPWAVLVPLDTGSCTSTIENVADRGDLLPFFIDDGVVGRRHPSKDFAYTPRVYTTARTALCQVFGNTIKVSNTQLSCDGVSSVGGKTGVIRLGNPKKAH